MDKLDCVNTFHENATVNTRIWLCGGKSYKRSKSQIFADTFRKWVHFMKHTFIIEYTLTTVTLYMRNMSGAGFFLHFFHAMKLLWAKWDSG